MKTGRKKLKLIAILLLLLAATIWVATRWNVWFDNPEELVEKPFTEPVRVLLTFGDEDELSRNVSWQCDTMLQPSWLELACDNDTTRIDAQGEVFESRNGKAAYYVARLRNLKPDRIYYYSVVSGGKRMGWFSFRTRQPGRDHFSFMYIGDVQDTIGGKTNLSLLDAFASSRQLCEFLVIGGDLTERPANQYWTESFRSLDYIRQGWPILNVTGNHDYLKGVIQHLERRFPLVFSYFLDSKVGDNMVYTLKHGTAQLFLLDTNREFFYLWTQRQWLKHQLENCDAKWKIVVMHHPLYSIKGKNNVIQRWMFDDLLRQYGVDLVLQGHEHAYARMTAHDKAGRAIPPVYTVSHFSPKNYRIHFDEHFDKFGISNRYYQVVSISGDTLAMAAYEADTHALYDSVIIIDGSPRMFIDLGMEIPESLDFTPEPNNKKDQQFAKRIEEYKKTHPERQKN